MAEVVFSYGSIKARYHNLNKNMGNLLGNSTDKDIHCIEFFQGGKTSLGATLVTEHQPYDAVVKAMAFPESAGSPGPEIKKISIGDLRKPSLWSHQNNKEANITKGMHGMIGFSGENLTW